MSESTLVYKNILSKYVPANALEPLIELLCKYPVHIRISKARRTKLGDYRPAQKGRPHQISINHDLNQYSFLITLVHEMAHLVAFEKYGRYIKPHGIEWKTTYRSLMEPFMELAVFPEELKLELMKFLKNAKASTFSSTNLGRLIKQYDEDSFAGITVEELPANTCFRTENGKEFRLIEKRRRRYKCLNLSNNKYYLFDTLVQVTPI